MPLRIVAISDTHGLHDQLSAPDGDVLVHAGDLTARGRREELEAFNDWLGTLPHRHKLVIAGNHDWVCARKRERRGAPGHPRGGAAARPLAGGHPTIG